MTRFSDPRRSIALLALLGLVVGAGRVARAEDDPHAGCTAPPGHVPAEILERPVGLRSGIGNSHEKVTTASAQAQALYDQGLDYLESFVWIEAARSFHQALRLDPGLALAYVGLSRVDSALDNPEGAQRLLEKAKALSSGVSAAERRRIEIRELQLAAMDDLADVARHVAYKRAIEAALAADFDDPQLWLLRGTAEEANASGRGQRGTAGSIAFYERALRIAPDHASAHHYLVHSYENIGRVDRALEHGEAYARLAPSIPHAAHMWGHDLRRVGRVDEAIAQFLKTDALERAYYEAERIDPSLDWHHRHNLDLLATCYEHKGQSRLAETTIRQADRLRPIDASGAFSRWELPSFLIRRGRHDEAATSARAMTSMGYPQARAVGFALLGQALVGMGDVPAARDALASARRELEAVPRVTPGIVPNRAIVEPWVDALHGELLLRGGALEAGREVLRGVQRELRATLGADAWIQTLYRLESIARTARETGDWEFAEYGATQMLEHDAAYAGSHLAMALVLRHRGDAVGARREFEAAANLWRDADPDLPEAREIARALTDEGRTERVRR